ncbi:contact-dependent growth inhibition system immunity protein [Nocardioides coralli]|uniref:contact-dependent growth inhibition system immunity protein n=1 Tax=Nocardioides coralli TaxID=2872154 RepID=UPI001CA39A83|nr:contact-dependent growth inhibition system immunity protein [Nocardioides coralli]QZY29723.1 hypothetical protein K6T13_03245 [Nocardioides coralli]
MDTPLLENLLGAYFHPDWRHEGTEQQQIDAFLQADPELAEQLRKEVDHVLAGAPSDEALESVLWHKGSYYLGDPERGGPRAFLERIAERARTHGP